MANEKTNETVQPGEAAKLVEIFIPKGNANEEPNLMVGINGKNYLLPRGKKSQVPPEVAYEVERSINAQETADKHIDEMTAMAAAEQKK